MLKGFFRGLGIAIAVAPMVLTIGGAIGTIASSAITSDESHKMTEIVREFKETNTYDVLLEEKKAEIDEAFSKGMIDKSEHANQLDYLVTDETTVQILQESESFLKPEYNKCLKAKERADIAGYSLLGCAGLGVVSCVVMYPAYFNGQSIADKIAGKEESDDIDYYM